MNINTYASERYMDTAAIGLRSLVGEFPRSNSELRSTLDAIPGISLFFAPNATQVVLPLVQYYTQELGVRVQIDGGPERIHPVLRATIKQSCMDPTSQNPVMIHTTMHWITGKILIPGQARESDCANSHIVIHDAVQAFGNLQVAELEALFEYVRKGSIIVGCLHKWIGCPIPLGFALLPTFLLKRDQNLADYLARRDYLGTSLGTRSGFREFPDSYSSSLSSVFMPYLALALGEKCAELESLFSTIQRNRFYILDILGKRRGLTVVSPFDICRGMVGFTGESEPMARLSAKLNESGFYHSIFPDWPHASSSTLRLSAPTTEMSDPCRAAFESILSEMQW